jgi:hypothetical protein
MGHLRAHTPVVPDCCCDCKLLCTSWLAVAYVPLVAEALVSRNN